MVLLTREMSCHNSCIPPRHDSYRHRVVVERNPTYHFHLSRCRAYWPSLFEPPLAHPIWCILHGVQAWHEPKIGASSSMQKERWSLLLQSVASMILTAAAWSVSIHPVDGRHVIRNRMFWEFRLLHESTEVWRIGVHRQCTNQREKHTGLGELPLLLFAEGRVQWARSFRLV